MPTEPTAQPSIASAPDAPSRQSPATFRARMDAFLAWMVTFVSQAGALATWMFDTATQVFNNATEAFNSAQASAASASAAAAGVNATPWVSGGTYSAGDQHSSLVNFKTYRATQNHSGRTTDPSLDTAYWTSLLTLDQAEDVHLTGDTRFDATSETVDPMTGTAPDADVSDFQVFTLTTSGNTSVAVISPPAHAWTRMFYVTFGGAHTFDITGTTNADKWGDQGAPTWASGDKAKIVADGIGDDFTLSLLWRTSA